MAHAAHATCERCVCARAVLTAVPVDCTTEIHTAIRCAGRGMCPGVRELGEVLE